MKCDEGQISKKKAFQFRQRKNALVKMHPAQSIVLIIQYLKLRREKASYCRAAS